MNSEKYTKNTIGVLNAALNSCVENGNSQIEDIHLLWGLIKEDDSLINNINDIIAALRNVNEVGTVVVGDESEPAPRKVKHNGVGKV